MPFDYEDVGEFGSQGAAEDWAKRNGIDPRDLHFRKKGDGVDVGIRKGSPNADRDYDDRHGGRRDGFWR
ncbi:hypothetical protein B2G71_22920 [Novosphingobium sp. PC22D]|uniref:hypothetical protein n=1 Tax=Novosphingobium sp. PC22D TaxID=1962403 RepID=UPI000BF0E19D|nr:hypothetical protein [Novosphingobium sp. PC22D]PEQ10314.1 hypothetical protein B2G71_22920 [Novosphingobium sp. PC22D]